MSALPNHDHCRAMRKRQPTWGPQEDTDLLGLYVKGVALADLADRLGWHERTVNRAMKRLELETLPRGRPPGSSDAGHSDRQR